MEISHYIDKDGNVVINASWNSITYGAVLIPKIIDGKAYIKKNEINLNSAAF